MPRSFIKSVMNLVGCGGLKTNNNNSASESTSVNKKSKFNSSQRNKNKKSGDISCDAVSSPSNKDAISFISVDLKRNELLNLKNDRKSISASDIKLAGTENLKEEAKSENGYLQKNTTSKVTVKIKNSCDLVHSNIQNLNSGSNLETLDAPDKPVANVSYIYLSGDSKFDIFNNNVQNQENRDIPSKKIKHNANLAPSYPVNTNSRDVHTTRCGKRRNESSSLIRQKSSQNHEPLLRTLSLSSCKSKSLMNSKDGSRESNYSSVSTTTQTGAINALFDKYKHASRRATTSSVSGTEPRQASCNTKVSQFCSVICLKFLKTNLSKLVNFAQ